MKSRIASVALAFAFAASTTVVDSQEYTIQIDLNTMSAEVDSIDEAKEGIKFTTVMPDGTVKDGLWDAVTGDDGVLRGMRVLNKPQLNSDGQYFIDAMQIAIRSRGAPFDGDLSREVDSAFVSDLDAGPLEVSWVTDSDFKYTIGTFPADDDVSTIPVFTRTSDGEIRQGLWEENATDKAVDRLTVNAPFRAEVLEDGTVEFLVGRMFRESTVRKFSPGYLKFNSGFTVFPVDGLEGGEPGAGKSSRGPLCFTLNVNPNNINPNNHSSLRSDALTGITQRCQDAADLYEYYFDRSCGNITIDVEFDNAVDGGTAGSEVTFFLAFLPDVRIALRDQADVFEDDEPIDFEMYSTIPFQSPNDNIDYHNQNGDFHSTKYIAVPVALYDQALWFDAPTVPPNQTIVFGGAAYDSLDTYWEFATFFHFYEPDIGVTTVETQNFYSTLLHEIAHCLGITSRGDRSVDRDGNAAFDNCTLSDLGPSDGTECDNFVEILDMFRFRDADIQVPFPLASTARAADRYFG